MTTQRHIIKKQILELALPSQETAFAIQNTVSRIYHEKVVPIIETCCSELSTPDIIQRVNTLEVDIGQLSLESLEEDFPARVESQIWILLREKLGGFDSSSSPSLSGRPGTARVASQLELFDYFIRTGTLPWWARKMGRQELEKNLIALIAISPDAVAAVIGRSLSDERSFKRLIYQYPDNILARSTRAFFPSLHPFIIDFTADLTELIKHADVLQNITRTEMRLELWRGIFSVIVWRKGAGLDKPRFVEEILIHLARRFGIGYGTLLDSIIEVAGKCRREGFRFQSELPGILAEIHEAVPKPGGIDVEESRRTAELLKGLEGLVESRHPTETLLGQVELVLHSLLQEALSPELKRHMKAIEEKIKTARLKPPQEPAVPEAKSEQELEKLLKGLEGLVESRHPTEMLLGQVESVLQSLLQEALSPELKRHMKLIEEKIKTARLNLAQEPAVPEAKSEQEIEKLLYQLQELLEYSHLSELLLGFPKSLLPSLFKQKMPLELRSRIFEFEKKSKSTKLKISDDSDIFAPEARDSFKYSGDLFSDSNEIYIQNAGLVLLWPFLNRFFESVGLVKEKRFVDLKATERGVHLLQYLVDGSTEMPEYVLPLNKVLCGMNLAEPVAGLFEITEEEVEESENILLAVIQNWSALGSISIEGFRIAFLQRDGLLTMRNSNWLVRVERQTHDILLDRIDWAISVIKLPWLDDIIYVEW